jgi:hypothetical protein
MKEILDYGFIIVIFLIITIPLGFLKFRIDGYNKDNKTIIRNILIINLSIVLIFTVYKFLPRHEVGIDIVINNKNTIPEININGIYYYMNENKNVKNITINNSSGYIGIKTEKESKVVLFINEESIFTFNRRIKININNENIKINSFLIKSSIINNDYEKYDDIIKLLNNR